MKDKCAEATKAYNTHLANIETAKTEKENAETGYQKAKETLELALNEKGYSDIQTAKVDLLDSITRSELHRKIVEYDTEYSKKTEHLNILRIELKNQIEPDSSKFEERQNEIDKEREIFPT